MILETKPGENKQGVVIEAVDDAGEPLGTLAVVIMGDQIIIRTAGKVWHHNQELDLPDAR